MNHSCDPTAIVRLPADRPDLFGVVAGPRGVKNGDEVTFFYPCTEWEMVQGFECGCGSARCLGYIRGAKWVDVETLKAYGACDHILRLKEDQIPHSVDN